MKNRSYFWLISSLLATGTILLTQDDHLAKLTSSNDEQGFSSTSTLWHPKETKRTFKWSHRGSAVKAAASGHAWLKHALDCIRDFMANKLKMSHIQSISIPEVLNPDLEFQFQSLFFVITF